MSIYKTSIIKKLLLFLFLVIVSCAKEEDNQTLPAALNYELTKDIIGKWDIQNTAKKVTSCRVFNVVFSQNEFTINYTGGQIKGKYTVDSETQVSITSTGDITNISISNGNISFNISIDNCVVSANGVKDNDYTEGECTTFLECLDGIYFSEDGELDDFVIAFFNNPTEKWYEQYYLNLDCYEIENPFTSLKVSDYSVEIIQNKKDILMLKITDGEYIDFVKLISFEDGSLSVGFSDKYDGVYEIDDDYVPLSQAKVFELQSILESSQECNSLNDDTQNCNEQNLIDLFNSFKDFELNSFYDFSFGRYELLFSTFKSGIGDSNYHTVIFSSTDGLTFPRIDVTFYYDKNNNALVEIEIFKLTENFDKTTVYVSGKKYFSIPGQLSILGNALNSLEINTSSFCELNDVLTISVEELKIGCTYDGQSNTGGNPLEANWAILTNTTVNTSAEGRNGRLEIVPSGGNGTYAYRWEFKPSGSDTIIQIDNNSGLLIPSSASEIPPSVSTTGSYTVYIYEGSLNNPCPSLKKEISITLVDSNSTYIPDNNFEQYLIDNGYDDILDDYVLTDNIVGIEEINYTHGGIKSLEGVQDFTELKRLVLFNYPDFVTDVNFADLQSRIDAGLKNDIQVADLSNNKKLVYVSLGRNISLESINVNGLTELIGLVLEGCINLPSVDLGTNTKLQWLDLGFNNKITEVDLTNLQELGHLSFRATSNLNSLDISNNDKIVDLDAQYTNLNCIKVSEYQIQNQINAKSIDGESSITVWYSDTGGQTYDVSWAKDSTTIFSLDCN